MDGMDGRIFLWIYKTVNESQSYVASSVSPSYTYYFTQFSLHNSRYTRTRLCTDGEIALSFHLSCVIYVEEIPLIFGFAYAQRTLPKIARKFDWLWYIP